MDIAELNRQVEDKPAPGPLLAVQAFLNTCDYEYGEELLSTPESTAEWLLSSGLATPDVQVGPRAQETLRGFRTALRSIVESHLTGEVPQDAIDELRAYAARYPVRLAADSSGDVKLDLAPVGSVDALIAQFLGLVFEAQRAGEWRRLKTCAAGAGTKPPDEILGPGECRWVFYDGSKNRGGQWCRMDLCGNRAKNRAYRRRSATEA